MGVALTMHLSACVMENEMPKSILTAMVLAAAALVPLGAFGADPASTISLTGVGVVDTAPDTVVVRMGVETVDDEARAAMAENSDKVRAILDGLRGAGIPEDAIQTADLTVRPLYANAKRKSSDAQDISGYRVTNIVRVQMPDAKALGAVLDRAVDAGANRIYGIVFGLQDNTEAMAEARRRAVADAKAKATLYADAAGVALGPIRSFVEQAGHSPRAAEMDRRSGAGAVPVQPGQVSTSVQVHIVWEIAPLR